MLVISQPLLVISLDLNEAFQTIDHIILLNRLQEDLSFNLRGGGAFQQSSALPSGKTIDRIWKNYSAKMVQEAKKYRLLFGFCQSHFLCNNSIAIN